MQADTSAVTDERDVILVVQPDPLWGEELADRLDEHFHRRYRVLRAATAEEARMALGGLPSVQGRTVTLFADDAVPEDRSALALLRDEDLAQVVRGRLLLTDEPERVRRDLSGREGEPEILVAPRRPRASPEEPSDDPFWGQVEKALYLAAPDFGPSAVLYGDLKSDVVFRAKRFLLLNHVPFYWDAATTVYKVAVQKGLLPEETLLGPTLSELAEALLGYTPYEPDKTYDLAVVGGGPAAMCAAVNAHALYGMSTVIVENFAPGGTAATANNVIENYLGFPDGIQPDELAYRWLRHTEKYEISWLHTHTATKLSKPSGAEKFYTLATEKSDRSKTKTKVKARTVLLACGMQTPRQGGKNEEKFRYKGVYYDALPADGPDYTEDTVAVIGGGDTAGRAVDIFATCGATVHLIIRSTFADAPMLEAIKKLVKGHKDAQRCRIWEKTEVEEYKGDAYLDQLVLKCPDKGALKTKSETLDVDAAFVLIGGNPNTKWLNDKDLGLYLDGKGFVQTMTVAFGKDQVPLATNLPGVFAAGDVRSGATRRIAAAVGDGGAAALSIYQYRRHHRTVTGGH